MPNRFDNDVIVNYKNINSILKIINEQTRKTVMANMRPLTSIYVLFKSHETAPEDCELEEIFRRENMDIFESATEEITQRPPKFEGDSETKHGVKNTVLYLLLSVGKITKATHT